MKKPKAIFELQHGGGSYKLNLYLVENATEKQNKWVASQGEIIFDYQLNGVRADLKNDGFVVIVK